MRGPEDAAEALTEDRLALLADAASISRTSGGATVLAPEPDGNSLILPKPT
jgi:hypothetical protein